MTSSARWRTTLWRCCHPTPQQRRSYTQQHSSKAGFRARTAMAQELLRTHGFRLAPINPLRPDGLMTDSIQEIEHAFPKTLSPLVKPFLHARQNQNAMDCLPTLLHGTDEEHVLKTLLQYYCSGIGYEMMQCATDEERQFFIQAAEESSTLTNTADTIWCFEQVARAGEWERLLSRRYPTCRRFSLEGLESGVLALNMILDTFCCSSDDNRAPLPYQQRVVLGTLHRGRVNVLHTVLQKSVSSLLEQWDITEGPTYDDINRGHSADVITKSGRNVHVSLLNMPAHLESQDAAVNGKAYGHMVSHILSENASLQPDISLDKKAQQHVLPLMVHGDSSFCGQGIVSETLHLSTYTGFDCGGTVHVIFNNQIGFTAETSKLRTRRHQLVNVSDAALGIRAPVLHVNAERPLDVCLAARIVTLYRQRFGKDVVLDLWGFRKHGHNEVEEPRITNVSLYQQVDRHLRVEQVFAATLTDTLRQECQQLQERIEVEYRAPFSHEPRCEKQSWANGNSAGESKEDKWLDFWAHPSSSDGVTSVGLQELKAALSVIAKIPDGFTLSPPTERAVTRRAELLEMLNSDKAGSLPVVDWATAELLALSTLGHERHFCRLSGQDSQRGTFTQRHAVWHDYVTGQIHHALPPLVQVVDTPLSELGVLGFEHGVSLASPNFLVLWEAQFADFSNNGQVLIDTMISSEKEKFGLQSNLVLLLPHGYDGMGPEHSSSRLERFLTLHTDTPEAAEQTKDDLERFRKANFTIIYPSTPSNYFHVLRRSFSWPFRRPMVVLTPKRTLRLPMATSPVTDFLRDGGSQTAFIPVLDDPRTLDSSQVKSIALCSGEIFYDVLKLLQDLPEEVSLSVAIVRVEQLAPFPLRQLKAVVDRYPLAHCAVWMQEEPYNMGALRFTAPFLERIGISLSAPISRRVSAAPAVGNPRDHQTSQLDLLSRIADWIEQGSKAA